MPKGNPETAQSVIKPDMDIVAPMVEGFRDTLLSFMDDGINDLIVDLDGVKIVDSVGLGVIIATHNSLAKVGGRLRVINASEDIYTLFTTMRLDQHFEVIPFNG